MGKQVRDSGYYSGPSQKALNQQAQKEIKFLKHQVEDLESAIRAETERGQRLRRNLGITETES